MVGEMPENKTKKSVRISGKLAMILVFVSGIVLGGSGVFIYELIKNQAVEHSLVQNDMQNLDEVDLEDSNEVVYQIDTSIVYPDTIPDSEAYEKIWNSLIKEPGYREMDSLFLDSLVKRIYSDSVMQTHRENYDMNLQNEELRSAKYMNVVVYTQSNDSSKTLQNNATDRYYVEFWESPINFEGYVKTGKSLKLYSIQPSEAISLVLIDFILYMRRNDKWFVLNETSHEKSFQRVMNISLLEILAEVQ